MKKALTVVITLFLLIAFTSTVFSEEFVKGRIIKIEGKNFTLKQKDGKLVTLEVENEDLLKKFKVGTVVKATLKGNLVVKIVKSIPEG